MQKKFIHKEKEVCGLCNHEINTNIDLWSAITDLEGKKQLVTKFYHRKCLTDLVTGKGAVIRKNFEDKLRLFTSKMFGNIPNWNKTQFELEKELAN
jgi:hypothetical protein